MPAKEILRIVGEHYEASWLDAGYEDLVWSHRPHPGDPAVPRPSDRPKAALNHGCTRPSERRSGHGTRSEGVLAAPHADEAHVGLLATVT